MGVRGFLRRWFRSDARESPPAGRDAGPTPRVVPPADWSDEPGWDAYHQAPDRNPHFFQLGLQYVPDLRAKGFRSVWFPGCGTSLAPRVFAELGFDVLCTDFSSVAVTEQQRFSDSELSKDILKMLEEHRDNRTATRLNARRRDFRAPLEAEPHDVILNVCAFQGLSRGDMRATAKSHFDAVRPGGWTIFQTMNVQGLRRDEIEDSIAEVGFGIPLRETERWYRSALRATAIEFLMILGRPRARGPGKSEKDQERLDALSSEYRIRADQELEATRAKFEAADVRIAHVVYSTG
jgi:Thiopurine S-methyltransferase (TPMT)